MCACALVFGAPLLVAAASPTLLRHVDGTDFFWMVSPETGERYFVDSEAEAERLSERFSVVIDPLKLAAISPRVSPGIVASDADADGLPDAVERVFGTDPNIADTDRDGYADGLEVKYGYSPTAGNAVRIVATPKAASPWAGRLVEDGDAFWYVHPTDGHRYYLGGRANLMQALFAVAAPVNRELMSIPVARESASWLKLPQGYRADIVVSGLQYPRVLAFDPSGQLVFSELAAPGKIMGVKDGKLIEILKGLHLPHGIAFAKGRMYVARETAVEWWIYDPVRMQVSGQPTKILDLPPGNTSYPNQGHQTRTIVLGSDGMLYVSIGSNCDSCLSFDRNMAQVLRIDVDGKKSEVVSRGLRNTVFFAQHPKTGEWWGNDMGQDGLGDAYPPDELNRLVMGRHYGWPYCVANQKAAPINPKPEQCVTSTGPEFMYGAHVAPLGIAFVPQAFDGAHEYDALVALHGSVVPSGRVGYEVLRVDFDEKGRPVRSHPYITGFLRGHGIVGRPTGIAFSPNGELYLSDDYAKVIYRIRKE